MFLPKSHHVSMLIVRYYHYILGHAGLELVLSVIRQSFWILRGRSLVRQILSKCVSFRGRNAPTLHAGLEHVLCVIRRSFWILRGRSLVRQILRKCVSFRGSNAPTLQQVMADLPEERLVPY